MLTPTNVLTYTVCGLLRVLKGTVLCCLLRSYGFDSISLGSSTFASLDPKRMALLGYINLYVQIFPFACSNGSM